MVVSDLALDPVTGDLLIEGGEARLVQAAAAIRQDWALRMTLFLGEWVLDRRVGIDYQNKIFDRPPGQVLLRHIFETVTRQTAGVSAINRLEFELAHSTRQLTVRAEVQTVAGETVSLVFSNVLFADEASA